MPPPAPGSRAYVRLVLILGVLSAMGPLAIDAYLPSFPAIARDLAATASSVELTVAVYFIGLGLGQAVYGPLADRVGRRLPLLTGLALFVLASIACASAATIEQLIAARFAQALGGCAEMVVARAMVRDFFDERESMRVLSLLMLVMGLAPILAPLAGAQLLVHFGWRAVFWTLAGIGSLTLAAVLRLLPESLPHAARRTQTAGEILLTYGRLLGDRPFMAAVLAGSFILAGMFAYIAGSPFVFIELFRVPPEQFGLFFGFNAAGLITASQINGRLARRRDAHAILRVVLPITALASVVLLLDAASGFGGFAGVLVPLFLCVASVGFVLPNTTALAMAPHGAMAGSASALVGAVQFLLGAAAGSLVSALSNGTAVPLGAVIAGCGIGACAVFLAATPRAPVPQAVRT